MQTQVQTNEPGAQGNAGQAPATQNPATAQTGSEGNQQQQTGGAGVATGNPESNSAPEVDESGWDDKTKAYIQKLRSESAQHRTRSKNLAGTVEELTGRLTTFETGMKKALGLETGEELTQDKFEQAQASIEDLTLQNAILQSAVENGITAEGLSYFGFKVTEALGALDEGEELSEEAFGQIVEDVRSKTVAQQLNPGGSSVNTPQTGNPDVNNTDVTVEQFAKMTLAEKSQLFQTKPDKYNGLVAEAKKQGILV